MNLTMDDLVLLVRETRRRMTPFDRRATAIGHAGYLGEGLTATLRAALSDDLDGHTPQSLLAGKERQDADGADTVALSRRLVNELLSPETWEELKRAAAGGRSLIGMVVHELVRGVERVFPREGGCFTHGHYSLLASHVYAAGLMLRERGVGIDS